MWNRSLFRNSSQASDRPKKQTSEISDTENGLFEKPFQSDIE